MNAVEKSQELLRGQLGDIEYTKFINKEPVTFPAREGTYLVHLTDEDRVDVARTIGKNTERGIIHYNPREKLFDATAAFIANARTGHIDWGCGHMGVEFPDEMPPPNLKFTTYLRQKTPNVKEKLVILGHILTAIPMFPYKLGKIQNDFVDGTMTCILLAMMTGIPLMLTQPSGSSDNPGPPFLTFLQCGIWLSYIIALFTFGLIQGSYKEWREQWS